MKCSLYKNTFDKTSKKFVEVETILAWIKGGKFKDIIERIRSESNKTLKSELKKSLMAVVFSGTFTSRYDDKLKDYSHLVIIDIDTSSSQVIDSVVVLMDSVDFCYSYFISPSGGIKILIRVDSDARYHRDFAFIQIKEFIESNSLAKVDSSGKNLSRLCYVSYDPNLYFNPKASAFPVDTNKKEVEATRYVFEGEVSYDNEYCFSVAKKWLNDKGEFFRQGNRNNYLHKMSCILNRAGFPPDSIINTICQKHNINQEIYKELQITVNSVCRLNSSEFGTSPILERKKQQNKIF
jgi:hypothetical protein